MVAIPTKTLTTFSDIHEYAKVGWNHRGQADANWLLSTSLERCCDRQGVLIDQRSEIERELLREFTRTYHQYGHHPPSSVAKIEWLALMQHHGAPTRLLDFTYSIYIATYFAIEHADGDAAVWALNGSWALRHSAELFRAMGKDNEDIRQLQQRFTAETDEQIAERLFMTSPLALAACPLNSFRLNERLRIQKGVFLVPGTIEATFMDNLYSLPGHDDPANIVRLIIPRNLRALLLRNLFGMNITRTSLFPGLDGFAQSLGVYHPVFNPDDPIRKSHW
jgi:hypothetical protein